ncbi:class I mannose-6-phosphate isomerase [Novosphingobium huizhouense]|uniref:class I mannose-6-phosphate isomerase n=1 Tax=Novosphingobium huizhouense TaxID=2866625 RepID=UPI001CD8C8F3|nr:class I mannose-6-phosphate isomerase [Novosphingobium huizhouense]
MSKLPIRTVEKPWGKDVLPAPFVAPLDKRIGEIWFEPPAEVPSLLVKYIFTSEKLSVQVHPSDEQAAASGETEATGYGGKEECWLVIDAEPGATLGVGFAGHVDAETMRAAALDGSIEDMLVWHPVGPGDFFYIPANTVHAIGAGVSLIEIQQNSDITYRLYDYGRPRELHLDKGIAVSRGEPLDPALRRHVPERGTVELASGRYFTAHRVDGLPDETLRAAYAGPLLVIPREGEVRLGDEVLRPGDCASAPGIAALTLPADGRYILVKAA